MTFVIVKDWEVIARRFAAEALLELSAAGMTTPAKGFIEEPFEFSHCIADLRRERDRMRQQLIEQDRILEDINKMMVELKEAHTSAMDSLVRLEAANRKERSDFGGAAMAESYRLQLEECDRKLQRAELAWRNESLLRRDAEAKLASFLPQSHTDWDDET